MWTPPTGLIKDRGELVNTMQFSSVLVVGLGFNAFGNVTDIKNSCTAAVNPSKFTVHDNSAVRHNYHVKDPLSLIELSADLNERSLSEAVTVSSSWDGTIISIRDLSSGSSTILSSNVPYQWITSTVEAPETCKEVKRLQLSSHKKSQSFILHNGSLGLCEGQHPGKPLLDRVASADCESEENVYVIRERDEANSVDLVRVDEDGTVCRSSIAFPLVNESIVHVSCGHSHSLFLGSSGSVYSAGIGSRGQLGHGVLETCKNPRLLEALAGVPIASVQAGGWHSMALSSCGDVYTWGWNNSGQLGLGEGGSTTDDPENGRSATPEVLALPSLLDDQGVLDLNFVSIAAGSRHSVAVSSDGGVWGWGWSAYGQLGTDSPSIRRPKLIPLDVFTSLNFMPRIVQCGPWNTFVILTKLVG